MMKNNLLPIKNFFLEFTNACNFNCSFCPDNDMKRKRGFMGEELAKRIIDELSEEKIANNIYCHLMGEPLLHPRIVEFVKYAGQKGLETTITTNASLAIEEKIKDLFENGLTKMIISLHAFDEFTFAEKQAKKDDWHSYKLKVKNVLKNKFLLDSPVRIDLHVLETVRFKPNDVSIVDNTDQAVSCLEEWITFGNELASRYDISKQEKRIAKIRKQLKRLIIPQPFEEDSFAFEFLPNVFLHFKSAGSWGNKLLPKDSNVQPSEHGYCHLYAPWNTFIIYWNGDCGYCCYDYDNELNLGNLEKQTIKEIFFGEKIEKIRQEMKHNIVSEPFCRRCLGNVVEESNGSVIIKADSLITRAKRYFEHHGFLPLVYRTKRELKNYIRYKLQ